MKKSLKLRKIVHDLELEVLAGVKGLDCNVYVEMVSRLALKQPEFMILLTHRKINDYWC